MEILNKRATELGFLVEFLTEEQKRATSACIDPEEAKQFINEIEKQVGIPVVLIGTGPEALDIIDRRK